MLKSIVEHVDGRAEPPLGEAAGKVPIGADQFIVNLMSLCIFPFAARPMIVAMLGLDQRGFEQFIARRRRDLAAFFLGALRP